MSSRYPNNCTNCKHKDTSWDEDGTFIISCLNGHKDKAVQFWKENGKLTSKEVTGDMDCHEHTEHSLHLNKLLDLTKEILDELEGKETS